MAQVTVEQSFQIAFEHHRAGHLPQAEDLYKQILARQPNHAGALHLLGVLAGQTGHHDVAVDLIRQAIALRPDWPEAHSNLGNVLRDQGQPDAAIAACRQAIALKPSYAEAHGNLGIALQTKGQLDEAIAAYRKAIGLKPNWPEAHYNLAGALKARGQLGEAIAAYRQAIALKPSYPEAYHKLGVALKDQGHTEEAIAAYHQAIALIPNWPEAYINLGNALLAKEQADQAVGAYRQAIALKPSYAEAHFNLGDALQAKGHLDEAIAAYRRAIALKPNLPEPHNNLGTALMETGQLEEAIVALRQAIALKPNWPQAHSNLILMLHVHPAYDAQAIADEHFAWNRQHAEPLRQFIRPHGNQRDPERRLRVGYVSGDFREHPIMWCIEPVLAHHDRATFEVFCYSNVRREDAITRRLQSYGHHWRSITALDDQQAADLIRSDGIDILVDLNLHTIDNRLLVFARKPAPVQVTHWGYPATTGLATIDYRITDRHLDPVGVSEAYNSETLMRLPHCFYCYVRADDPPAQPPPVRQGGGITFGSLNNLAKITPPVIELWCRILRALPSARLLIPSAGGGHGDRRLLDQFVRHGAANQCIQLVPRTDPASYLKLYRGIDIGLDPFPYNGGITTCDALWMGVPVVTLRGRTSVGRAGVSILSTIGLTELIADTPDEYVKIAVGLATDVPRLEDVRLNVRQRMLASPLMDAEGYTRDLEIAYRRMWQSWCAKAL